MNLVLAFIFIVLAVAVVAMMIVQAYRGTHPLLSVRNFFLVGFVIFQLMSAALSLWTLTWGEVTIDSPMTTGVIYLFAATTFLVLFLWSYSRGWWVRRFAWRSRFPFPVYTPSTLLSVGGLLLVVGFVLRIVIGRNVPVLGVLTDVLAVGVLASAAGLAMWAWAPRLWNLAVAVPAGFIILGAIACTVFQTFGRRDVVCVLLTVLFAAYQSHWRHQGWLRLAYRLGGLGVAGLIFLAAFSTVRSTTSQQSDFGDVVRGITEADVGEGLTALASGQFAAANSMWVIENRPDPYPYDPFHSIVYTVTNPIPRIIWPGKPDGLGYAMVRQARVYKFSENFTLGPGIIGHIFNDNPWLTLIPYAILFGLMWRFFDEYLVVHSLNPFITIPAVVGAGEIVGIPRGEVGLFLFRSLAAMFAAWVAMRLCAGYLRAVRGSAYATAEASPENEGDEADAGVDLGAGELQST
ncbi:MAG: hypothetical protein KF678_13610 [Phycisphaeraceae bacterium]|nr:hypothetical protein [Phycisphaeraceae bacterium]